MLAWRVAYRWSRRCLTRWPLTRALLILYSACHRIDVRCVGCLGGATGHHSSRGDRKAVGHVFGRYTR